MAGVNLLTPLRGRMAPGKTPNTESPLVRSLRQAQSGTTATIRVHICDGPVPANFESLGEYLFIEKYGLHRSTEQNNVLLLVDFKTRQVGYFYDPNLETALGASFWRDLQEMTSRDLNSTWFEYALALAAGTLGQTLQKHFPNMQSLTDRRHL